MSIERVCFRCGYEWEQRKLTAPRQCPYCKSPKWAIARGAKAPRPSSVVADLAPAYRQPEPEILPPSTMGLDDLRAIAAGNFTRTADPFADHPSADRQPCPYTEYDGETGETYRCGLAAHPAKVKHTRGPKV